MIRTKEADLIKTRDVISDLIGESINPLLNRNLEATKEYLTKLILSKNGIPYEN